MPAASIPPQGSEFDNFLYAPIYDDREGITLSVLSALARKDIDPWTEAARLSQLPHEVAVEQITDLLDALPSRVLGCFDRVETAARLGALLPKRPTANSPQTASTEHQDSAKGFSLNWQFVTVYISLMLLMNWAIAECHALPSASTESDSSSGLVEKAPDLTNNGQPR